MNGMDINAWKEQLLTRLGKYRYVLLVILAGVVLLLLPPAGEREHSRRRRCRAPWWILLTPEPWSGGWRRRSPRWRERDG